MTREQIVEQLRKLCIQHKSQKAVATFLGISDPYLSDILAGKRAPGPKVLKALGLRRGYERA